MPPGNASWGETRMFERDYRSGLRWMITFGDLFHGL